MSDAAFPMSMNCGQRGEKGSRRVDRGARRIEDRFGLTDFDKATQIHHGNPVGHESRCAQITGDDYIAASGVGLDVRKDS